MNPKDILKNIIQHDGSCTGWANRTICNECPLGKLKQKEDGSNLSCIEAINIENLSEIEADKKYKAAAENTLADMEIQSILEDNKDKDEQTE